MGTQAIATLIAVYGLFMTPIGWWRALAVWAYVLGWFLINDRIKVRAYRDLERHPASPRPAKGSGGIVEAPAS